MRAWFRFVFELAHGVQIKSCSHKQAASLAEGVRFELTVGLHLQRFSRPSHSTALAPLHVGLESGVKDSTSDFNRKWALLPRLELS